MNVLFIVAHGASGGYLRGLSGATGDGVRTLSDSAVVDCAEHAAEAVVCDHSWGLAMQGASCPLALGSQTDHSRMLGSADRVVAL